MNPLSHKFSRWSPRYLAILLASLLVIFTLPAEPARADVAASPCPGNICAGELTVGTDKVRYSFTQHVNPNGEFKIRLDGGTYNTGSLISFIIFDLPPFVGWNKYAGPGGAIYLPGEDVNPGRTAYERRSPGGCAGCRVDQVMSVKYAGLAPGSYTFNLFILQNGGSASKNNLQFFVDAAAPDNGNENDSLELIGDTLTCADRAGGSPIDNDLDYRANCADADCDTQQGDLINSNLRCELVEHTCDDDFDNDADDATDCQDQTCDGQIGRQPPDGSMAYCQYGNEYGDLLSLNGTSPCGDYFDNDADGRDDCYDNTYFDTATGTRSVYDLPAAAVPQSRVCWRHPAYGCPLTENSCTDSLDNDKDKSYSADDYDYDPWPFQSGVSVPRVPSGGSDCRDYDCAGDPYCPDQENHKIQTHEVDECQCFNGIDDDLDHLLDCKDPDCVGAYCETTGRICLDKEFDLGQRIQMCANTFDDDGDGPQDCNDSDCRQKFGDCGPCPSREDFTYEACADGKDNDVNGQTDCHDLRCNGQFVDGVPKLGRLIDAAYCAADDTGEFDTGAYPDLCADGMDNDSDGKTDCADMGCDGFDTGIGGPYCEMPAELSCDDGFDNDSNGLIDCVDPACHGKADCADVDWDDGAACIVVPRMPDLASFTANDPTVRAQAYATVHVNAPGGHDVVDRVRIKGDDVYTSVTMVIGDNTDINKVYPYARVGTCRIVNTPGGGGGKDDFGLTVVENILGGGAIMIYNLAGRMPTGFDITVECETPEQPAIRRFYPISISMLRLGDIPEYGEILAETRLYEATRPAVTEIEVEGDSGGMVEVPYNESRRFRPIPNDPNSPPLYSSGICQCEMELVGESPAYTSADGSCSIPAAYKFTRDFSAGDTPSSVTVSATSLDGAANRSFEATRSIQVNVTPAPGDILVIEPPPRPDVPPGESRPFFNQKETANTIIVTSKDTSPVLGQFITAENDVFSSICKMYIRNSAGDVVGGPGWIDVPNINSIFGPANMANCQTDEPLPLPAELVADGTYFVTLLVEDSDGDYIETNRQALFMCDTIPGPESNHNDGNVCHWADFDSDGAAEGFYTKLYSNDAKSCDNCVNLFNDTQKDDDANGIGYECQGLEGRCEVDTDIVCEWHSPTWDDPENPGTCPDGPKCCDDPADPTCCPEPTIKPDTDGDDKQACREPWGACSTGGEICFTPENCPKRGICVTGECVEDDCSCNSNSDCLDEEGNAVADSCIGADLCLSLMYPWIQAPKGNVYSGRYIRTPEPPPEGRANATFCITAKSGINWFCEVPIDLSDPVNKPQGCALANRKYVFTSEECGDPRTKPGSRFERPKSRNVYSTVLGRLDLGGLLSGKYGEVVVIDDPDQFAANFLNNSHLGGKVYLINGDLNFGAVPDVPPAADDVPTNEVTDAPTGEEGAGTVLVMGGNLYFWNNVVYSETLPGGLTALDRLASIGWIVLDDTDPESPGYGSKGNVFVGSTVTKLAGAFFIAGQGGIYTVAPPETDSIEPLTVSGLIVARQFHFSRSFKSTDQGSERVFYDGRAVVNPPPGFGDVTKTLPYFGDVSE